jgi:hypothetical protein
VIVSAMVKVKLNSMVGTNPFSWSAGLLFDIRKGAFSGNAALEAADFQAAPTSYSLAWFNKSPIQNWLSATVYSAGGIGNYNDINRNGLTQLRLRFSKDSNDNNAADYRAFLSGNSAYKPVLWITYYVP